MLLPAVEAQAELNGAAEQVVETHKMRPKAQADGVQPEETESCAHVLLCQQLRSWGCRPAQADPPGCLIT